MKTTHTVYAIVLFSVIASITTPHILQMTFKSPETYELNSTNKLASVTENVKEEARIIEKASNNDIAIAMPIVVEEKKEEKTEEKAKTEEKIKQQPQAEEKKEVKEEIVYDGMTSQQLIDKLNKVLNSNLKGTGNLFATYSLQYGVDPYLATAIALHETGCKWNCSSAVRNHNNVGGMMSGGTLIHFNSLQQGIEAFIKNLKTRYISQGLTTPEQLNSKYASSSTWASKIRNYMSVIKNA